MDLEVKGFIETSFLDWDSKVVSTIFLPGCNFRCPFCHNFGLIQNPLGCETIQLKRIEDYMLLHRDFIDGLCITGGEPALHKDRGLFDFMRQIKNNGFEIKLDTNGADPNLLKRVFEEKIVAYIAMDIKAPLNEKYYRVSGVKTDLEKIKQSIKMMMESGVPYEFRTTIVPTLLDMDDVAEIAHSIKGASKFVLQQFSPVNCWDKKLGELKPYSKEKFKEIAEASKAFVDKIFTRGV